MSSTSRLEQVNGVVIFNYSTATGGVWKGDIGQMEVNVHLRDGLTVDDLEWTEGPSKQAYCFPDRNEWTIISPTELQLKWTHFEPRRQENRREFQLATTAELASASPDK